MSKLLHFTGKAFWALTSVALIYFTYASTVRNLSILRIRSNPEVATASLNDFECGVLGWGCPISWTNKRGLTFVDSALNGYDCRSGAMTTNEAGHLSLPTQERNNIAIVFQASNPKRFCLGFDAPEYDFERLALYLIAGLLWLALGRFTVPTLFPNWTTIRRILTAFGESTSFNPNTARSAYNAHLYGMVFHLMKADAATTVEESALLAEMADHLVTSSSRRDAASVLEQIKRAATDPRTFREHAVLFCQRVRENEAAKNLAFEWLATAAIVDGRLNAREEQLLMEAGVIFGLTVEFVRQSIVELRKRSAKAESTKGSQAGKKAPDRQDGSTGLAWAYRELNCVPGAGIKEIRRNYRMAAKEYHPDAVRNKGLPPELVQKAEQKFLAIQRAYEALSEPVR